MLRISVVSINFISAALLLVCVSFENCSFFGNDEMPFCQIIVLFSLSFCGHSDAWNWNHKDFYSLKWGNGESKDGDKRQLNAGCVFTIIEVIVKTIVKIERFSMRRISFYVNQCAVERQSLSCRFQAENSFELNEMRWACGTKLKRSTTDEAIVVYFKCERRDNTVRFGWNKIRRSWENQLNHPQFGCVY